MKKTMSPFGVLQISSWPGIYSFLMRRFLINRNMCMGLAFHSDHAGSKKTKETEGKGRERTDCRIVHDDQNVSVSSELVQHGGEL